MDWELMKFSVDNIGADDAYTAISKIVDYFSKATGGGDIRQDIYNIIRGAVVDD